MRCARTGKRRFGVMKRKKFPSPNRVKRCSGPLARRRISTEASALGSLVDRHLAERLYEPSLGSSSGRLLCCCGGRMPSILIETGLYLQRS